MFTAMAIAAGIGGIIKGAGAIFGGLKKKKAKQAQYKDQMLQKARQEELFSQAKGNLDKNKELYAESWELQKDHLLQQKDENIAELGLLSELTVENRDRVLGQNQSTLRNRSELDAMQLSTMDVSAKNAVDQGAQRSALSGFRGSGTSRSLERNISEASGFQREQATLQQSMSVQSAYNQTKNSFIASNQQIDSYRRNMDQVTNNFDRASAVMQQQKKAQEEQFRQQEQDLNTKRGWNSNDLRELNDGWDSYNTALTWEVVMGSAGGIIDGMIDGAKIGAKFA